MLLRDPGNSPDDGPWAYIEFDIFRSQKLAEPEGGDIELLYLIGIMVQMQERFVIEVILSFLLDARQLSNVGSVEMMFSKANAVPLEFVQMTFTLYNRASARVELRRTGRRLRDSRNGYFSATKTYRYRTKPAAGPAA